MANNAEEKTVVNSAQDFDKSKTPIRGPEAFPLLEIVHGPKQGVWFTVAHQKEITLGRAATNHILLEDNSVSRSHAVLEADGEGFKVRDIGSRNGTFVNDQKIQGEVPLKHLDTIKVGIYVFRYLTEPTEAPFEFPGESATVMETPPEANSDGSTGLEKIEEGEEAASEAEPAETGEDKAGEASAQSETEVGIGEDSLALQTAPEDEPSIQEDLVAAMGESETKPGRSLKGVLFLVLALVLLGGGAGLAYYLGAFDGLKDTASTDAKNPGGSAKGPNTDASADKTPVNTKPLNPDQAAPVGDQVPIFLEVSSTPLPAKIFFQGKELGVSPFKINVSVPAGKTQELTAEIFLPQIDESLSVKQNFSVAQAEELAKVDVKLPLGQLQILALPPEGRLFLEGKFKGEKGGAKSLELKDIEYNKPVYLPFGKYVVEIRVPEKLSGSQSTVDQVRFRRDFVLAASSPTFEINAPAKAMKSFPAKITTQPSEASLWLNGKKIGVSPFSGEIPTGRHTLVIKKEGFSDFEKEIAIELNTPYEVDFNLETSPAGVFVNQARNLLKQGKTQGAIEKLIEALKRQPEPIELSQIHLLLGEAFLKSKNYDKALAYFQKEAPSTEYGSQAKLGMAQAFAGLGQKDQALIQVVDVFLKTKDAKLKSQAETTFKLISPMKSVLYVTSEPSGAQVTIGGNAIGQVTPVILSDLMLGNYRVGVTKEGFKSVENRVTLPISTIKPVIVKLEANP